MSRSILGYSALGIAFAAALFYLMSTPGKPALMQGQDQEIQADKGLDEKVKKLLEIVRQPNPIADNPEVLAQAIEELGERRIKQAVPDLIRYLNFRRKHDWEGSGVLLRPLAREGDYPAVGALFSIGKPALPGLLMVIEEQEPNSIESKNALRTIQLIFRGEWPKAVEYLESASESAATPIGKQRLQSAVSETRILCSKVTESEPEK